MKSNDSAAMNTMIIYSESEPVSTVIIINNFFLITINNLNYYSLDKSDSIIINNNDLSTISVVQLMLFNTVII